MTHADLTIEELYTKYGVDNTVDLCGKLIGAALATEEMRDISSFCNAAWLSGDPDYEEAMPYAHEHRSSINLAAAIWYRRKR